jgi:GTP-binding protein
MFLDQVRIHVAAGDGGAGAIAFRRESGVPRGGPNGGDGGKGGDVILAADAQLATLLDFRYRQRYAAERGAHGEGSNRTGRSGGNLLLTVPPGTVVRDVATGETVGELLEPEQRLLVARGGRGGRGNARFATATNQAPRRADTGGKGEERELELELKLIADVGLVGEPNAGKSTLLATLSAATPRIADYPFTTLTPNLGVVQVGDERSFVLADIPGIIEGAHEGKGLGLRFLRHVERTRTLAVLIPADDPDPQATYARLRSELAGYSEELAAKPHCVVVSKTDLLPPDAERPSLDAPQAWGSFTVSAATRQGLDPLREAFWQRAAEEGMEGDDDADPTLAAPDV